MNKEEEYKWNVSREICKLTGETDYSVQIRDGVWFPFVKYKPITNSNYPKILGAVEVDGGYYLYPHQLTILEQVLQNDKDVLVQMPTGSGKTRTAMKLICEQIRRRVTLNPYDTQKIKIIWTVTSNILINQAVSEFKRCWYFHGSTVAKIYTDNYEELSYSEDETDCFKIVFITIQQLNVYKKDNPVMFEDMTSGLNYVYIDEAHSAGAEVFLQTLNEIRKYSPRARFIGLTATPGRPENISDKALASFFSFFSGLVEITIPASYDNVIDYLIGEKYLSKINPKYSNTQDSNTLIETYNVVKTYVGPPYNRKRIIIFSSSIDNAIETTILLNSLYPQKKLEVRFISGETPSFEREQIFQWYREDSEFIKILANVKVLTEGFDAPETDCVIVVGNKNSYIELSQMLGRGMRGKKAGGTDECIVHFIQTRDKAEDIKTPAEIYSLWYDNWKEKGI